MRMEVCVEGVKTPSGFMVDPGSMYVDLGRSIPVVLNGNHTMLIGKATDFRRDESSGRITMHVELGDEWRFLNLERYYCSVFSSPIEIRTDDKGVEHIIRGRIREISLLESPRMVTNLHEVLQEN